MNELSRYELMISVEPMNVEPCIDHGTHRSACDRCSAHEPAAPRPTLAPPSRGSGTSGVLIRYSRITDGRRGRVLASSVLPFLSTCPSWTPSEVGAGRPTFPGVGRLVWEMLQGRRNDREMELTGAHPSPNLVSALAVQIQNSYPTERSQ